MAHAKVLIVEDEILVAREIESHLDAMGYAIAGLAIAAESVLKQVAETLTTLVLMDINLPGAQDGITIAGEIRDRFQIPVVYITAYADPNTLERAKMTDPYGYVLKPFSEPVLRVAIELALFRHQTRGDRSAQATPDITQTETLPGGLPPRKLQAILRYIDDNLNQTLSLEKLAQAVGITPYYFARLFKQSTGKSVHQYIIQQRVERAKQLLRADILQTDGGALAQSLKKSIAEIARECGFANPSHLALHFKRIVGVSPKKFRCF